jgi:hypothetical protein
MNRKGIIGKILKEGLNLQKTTSISNVELKLKRFFKSNNLFVSYIGYDYLNDDPDIINFHIDYRLTSLSSIITNNKVTLYLNHYTQNGDTFIERIYSAPMIRLSGDDLDSVTKNYMSTCQSFIDELNKSVDLIISNINWDEIKRSL